MPQNDEYDFEEKKEPTCLIDVQLRSPEDSKRFLDTLDRFASKHGLVAGPRSVMSTGNVLAPIYDGTDLLIAPLVLDFPQIPTEKRHAQARLHLKRKSYTWEQFLEAAESFHSMFVAEFGDQIIGWEEPNRGE